MISTGQVRDIVDIIYNSSFIPSEYEKNFLYFIDTLQNVEDLSESQYQFLLTLGRKSDTDNRWDGKKKKSGNLSQKL